MTQIAISSNLVTTTFHYPNRITRGLIPELIEWLEVHTGEPMLIGEGVGRRLNPSRGWDWRGSVYDGRGGYIDFDPHLSRVAMLFKLTWGGDV